jgi:uncharacterized repeat protein (TIGR03803 family)
MWFGWAKVERLRLYFEDGLPHRALGNSVSEQPVFEEKTMERPSTLNVALVTVLICLCSLWGTAQTFTVLHTFQQDPNSEGPTMGLVRDASGNLYGTVFGLLAGSRPKHYGAAFKVDANGKYTTLRNFGGSNGANPLLGYLRLDSAGNLYGLTGSGGANSGGTVYTLDRHGKETILYSFSPSGRQDGNSPRGSIVRDAKGNIFGTTLGGGTGTYGTVFKVDTTGKETVLHNFKLGDGTQPAGGVTADPKGNLYGVTFTGGPANAGTVFKVTPLGKETILYAFTGGADGSTPSGDLLLDSAGNLYGTTQYGGAHKIGTIFKLDPAGKETVLHSFEWPTNLDGAQPYSGLIRDAAGNFYGTTWAGGGHALGTVYKMDPSGNVTILYSFQASDGSPAAGLVLDPAGNLYGTTVQNPVGAQVFGVVYKIAP